MTSILSTISVTFLGLIAALLGVAILMEALPAYGRYLVFPFVLAGWLISLCLHEFGHAIIAYRSGDRSVLANGYLTLDPLRYTDLQFSIFWPLVYLAIGGVGLPGGAVYLNKHMIRSPADRSLVSAAGPFATLTVFVLLLVILRATEGTISAPFYAGLAFLAFLQLTALVLNLLPVPGLDGWGVIEPWLRTICRNSVHAPRRSHRRCCSCRSCSFRPRTRCSGAWFTTLRGRSVSMPRVRRGACGCFSFGDERRE